jgi:hypothetical protein
LYACFMSNNWKAFGIASKSFDKQAILRYLRYPTRKHLSWCATTIEAVFVYMHNQMHHHFSSCKH